MTPVKEPRFYIEYQNDVGPRDESFWEWWEVMERSGDKRSPHDRRIAKCDTEDDAERVASALEASIAPETPSSSATPNDGERLK